MTLGWLCPSSRYPSQLPAESVNRMALKVGDVTTCVVLNVNSSVAQVKAQEMPGVIRGPEGSRAKVGEHLRIRIVDFDGGGARFVAVRAGGS